MDRNETSESQNLWNELIALRDRQRMQRNGGAQVIKRSKLSLEKNDFGMVRWYLHPAMTDAVLSTLMFFQQEIPPKGRSGRLKFQGGQVMLILEGHGFTRVDGVKHDWKAGDVVNLPLRSEGITIQHFNSDETQVARFVAAEPNWFDCTGVDRGCGFELLEPAP